MSTKFQKGHKKIEGSGRKKGQTCILATDVRTRLQELGCDPIAGLAIIAAREDVSPELQAHCLGKLSKFCYPELKATDHRFVDEDGKDRSFTLADARALAAGG